MKLLLLFIVFTTLSSGMFSQQKIEWTEKRKLSFDDFRGDIGVSTAAAVSSVIIRYEIVSQSIWTGRIKIKIFAAFDTSSSWIKPEFKNLNPRGSWPMSRAILISPKYSQENCKKS